jgi:hypothetical protein
LLVTEPALSGRSTQQPSPGHNLSERISVDDVTLVAAVPRRGWFFASPKEHRMVEAQAQPARFG